MSKHLKVTLIALMLVAALAACGKDNPQNTTNPTGEVGTSAESEPTVTEPPETTVPETTVPETTAPETAPSAPLPEVKDGTVYTKEAIDYAFGGGSFGFTHSLLIPAIDSTKPGAEALNAKMLADQQEKLDALAAGKEENVLTPSTTPPRVQTAFSSSMSTNTSGGSIPRAAPRAVSTTMTPRQTAN